MNKKQLVALDTAVQLAARYISEGSQGEFPCTRENHDAVALAGLVVSGLRSEAEASRAGSRWTEEDDQQLVAGLAARPTELPRLVVAELAKELGRSEGAIVARLEQLVAKERAAREAVEGARRFF